MQEAGQPVCQESQKAFWLIISKYANTPIDTNNRYPKDMACALAD
jgi:hypothetical protein